MVQNATSITITDSVFERNRAENGGAVYLNNCTAANISTSLMNFNAAAQQGGGLFQVRPPAPALTAPCCRALTTPGCRGHAEGSLGRCERGRPLSAGTAIETKLQDLALR